jgi:hypothetical protein
MGPYIIITLEQNDAPHLSLGHIMGIFQWFLFIIKSNKFEVTLQRRRLCFRIRIGFCFYTIHSVSYILFHVGPQNFLVFNSHAFVYTGLTFCIKRIITSSAVHVLLNNDTRAYYHHLNLLNQTKHKCHFTTRTSIHRDNCNYWTGQSVITLWLCTT